MPFNSPSSCRPLRHLSVSILVALVSITPVLLDAADDVSQLAASPSEIAKTLAGKKTYDFAIISATEVVDFQGRHFSPADSKAYLKKAKPDKKGAYVFWVSKPEDVKIIETIVPAFSDYGVTTFVVRKMDSPAKANGAAAPVRGGRKTLIVVGQPNPKALSASDKMPDLTGRPPHLRPGALPRRVRYRFSSDAEVIAAAQFLTAKLLDAETPAEASTKVELVMVNPGAWTHLSNLAALKGTKSVTAQVQLTKGVVKLEGRFLDQPAQLTALIGAIRDVIREDGNGVVRALSSEEMNFWWTYIGFDIEEPVFVIETTGGHHRFVVGCHDSRITLVDELNALPR